MSEAAAYDAWHSGLEVNSGWSEPWHELLLRHLVPERDLTGRHVLEVACGRGGLARWIASGDRRPHTLVGADLSRIAVTKASVATEGLAGVAFEVADVTRLPHPSDTFDTIISCETIEHVARPRLAVQELRRVLRPSGRLFLTCPNYLGSTGLYRAYLRARGRRYTEAGQPINHLTMVPRTLRWLRAGGLEVVAWDTAGHYAHVPGRSPVRLPWLDQAGRLTRPFGLHSIFVAIRR